MRIEEASKFKDSFVVKNDVLPTRIESATAAGVRWTAGRVSTLFAKTSPDSQQQP
jgi:hypothetical protein